jgi:D-alanyl-D-alanine carboxypeptidase/D-alanyl-D-alanine-endopeptidase (penicillin-binding protein 4)
MRMGREALLVLAALSIGTPLVLAQSLEQRIAAVLETPAAKRASWGILAVRLADGAVLYERNARVPMTPASNTKLVSTALALLRLGPEYRFLTRVLAPQAPDAEGRLRGDLRLVGGGDPTLSGRVVPYSKDAKEGDPLGPLAELADRVAASGLRVIDGDVVGDATRWPWTPWPAGWAVGDMTWEYGAPVSALAVNDNAVRLAVRPGRREGEPAVAEFYPPVEPFTVHNTLRTRAGAERRIEVYRAPASRVLEIRGVAPPGGGAAVQWLAVPDPAHFTAEAFALLLRQRGIVIRGQARGLTRAPGVEWSEPRGVELARRESPPLLELARIVNKVSQNLHAEMLLRETAHVTRGEGSAQAGAEEMKALLKEAGADEADFDLEDGSGLSRRGLLDAFALTALLRHIEAKGLGDAFRGLLPVAGADGTLNGRFRGMAEASAIRAKTGSLSHVAALSGYAGHDPARRAVFSILVNGYTAPASEVRALVDKIAIEILKESER